MGYDDKKEFRCICCGKMVLTTKFASALKVKCDTCKSNNAPESESILEEIKSSKKSLSKKAVHSGETKTCKCTQCGADVEVTKFASASKVLCDTCKGDSSTTSKRFYDDLSINMDKLAHIVLPPLDEYYIMPTVISNRRLREVKCPACGHEFMKIFKIMDCSVYGAVIHYQCHECYLIVSISEQCGHIISPIAQHVMLNYRGEEIIGYTPSIQDTKMRNIIEYLMEIIEEHDIKVEGIKMPESFTRHELDLKNRNMEKGLISDGE